MSDWRRQARDLLQNTALSYHDVGVAVGRSRDTIARFCKEQNILRPAILKGHISFEDKPKLSPQHTAVGLKVALARNDLTLTQMSEATGISRYTLRAMEHGVHDYTLTELQKLSIFMDILVKDLL